MTLTTKTYYNSIYVNSNTLVRNVAFFNRADERNFPRYVTSEMPLESRGAISPIRDGAFSIELPSATPSIPHTHYQHQEVLFRDHGEIGWS